MQPLIGLAGGLLVLFVLYDTLLTTLRFGPRGGPWALNLSRAAWAVLRRLDRRDRGGPVAAGSTITLLVVVSWLSMLVAGWFLLFSSSTWAILNDSTGVPADGPSRLYFALYVVSTLGIGDYVPGSAPWQALTGIASITGFAVATLTVTYLVSLMDAVTQKRTLARSMTSLGEDAAGIVLRGSDGERFSPLTSQVESLTPGLTRMAEQHLAFPVLLYFRPAVSDAAFWAGVAALDDALFILDEVVDPGIRPPTLSVDPARSAIGALLAAVPERSQRDDDASAGGSSLRAAIATLRSAGLSLRADDEIDRSVCRCADRRQRLMNLAGPPVAASSAHSGPSS